MAEIQRREEEKREEKRRKEIAKQVSDIHRTAENTHSVLLEFLQKKHKMV